MKINTTRELKSLDGKVIGTLKNVCIDPLLAVFPDEQSLAGEEKLKRYILARKVHEAEGEVEVTAEEIALLKKLIGKGYGPMIVGQAWEALEGK